MIGKDLILDGDLLADGFEECIIGVANIVIDGVSVRKVIYDSQAMVDQLAMQFQEEINGKLSEEFRDPHEEALEYLEFNTFNAYVGAQTPLYLWDFGHED